MYIFSTLDMPPTVYAGKNTRKQQKMFQKNFSKVENFYQELNTIAD